LDFFWIFFGFFLDFFWIFLFLIYRCICGGDDGVGSAGGVI